MLLAHIGTWSLGELLVAIIVVCALIAVMLIALRAFGMALPQWVIQIGVVLLVAVVAVLAIRFLLTL